MKVATCCYCGTRAALVLRGNDRHELACAQCGAPLHDLKMMPANAGGVSRRRAAPAHPARTLRVEHLSKPTKTTKRPKRRKSLTSKLVSELWDVVEDIFD
ncbi:hypothetical protein [Loktanella gaetbuli]|nr:hypothetical protein [Loktanella gaetbuli]